jgi:hypothetical protein
MALQRRIGLLPLPSTAARQRDESHRRLLFLWLGSWHESHFIKGHRRSGCGISVRGPDLLSYGRPGLCLLGHSAEALLSA